MRQAARSAAPTSLMWTAHGGQPVRWPSNGRCRTVIGKAEAVAPCSTPRGERVASMGRDAPRPDAFRTPWRAGRGTCAARMRGGSGATRRRASGGPSMASTHHVPRPSTMAPVPGRWVASCVARSVVQRWSGSGRARPYVRPTLARSRPRAIMGGRLRVGRQSPGRAHGAREYAASPELPWSAASHHAERCLPPDQPDSRPDRSHALQGVPLMPRPPRRHARRDGSRPCGPSPPRRHAPSCWPTPRWPAGPAGERARL
jgi:hypothetical protein